MTSVIKESFFFRSESADHQLSGEELYQLLAYATKCMREECIKKQKGARIEITKRFVEGYIYGINLLKCINYVLKGTLCKTVMLFQVFFHLVS